ncbi:hypothetical protein ABVT39_002032, partial [Epinephelus coioides]
FARRLQLWTCNHNNCVLIGSPGTGINKGVIQCERRMRVALAKPRDNPGTVMRKWRRE